MASDYDRTDDDEPVVSMDLPPKASQTDGTAGWYGSVGEMREESRYVHHDRLKGVWRR